VVLPTRNDRRHATALELVSGGLMTRLSDQWSGQRDNRRSGSTLIDLSLHQHQFVLNLVESCCPGVLLQRVTVLPQLAGQFQVASCG
jgi:hypothetical protein